MKILLQGLLVLAGLCFFLGPVQAEPETEISLKPSRTVKVGGVCRLILQISWKSEEANYSFTRPDLALENLAFEEIGESNEVFQKGGEVWKKKTFRTDLKALKAGKGRIRSFTVTYIDPIKQEEGHFEVPEKQIKIVPDRSRLYEGIALTTGLLSMGGLLAWRIFLGRRRKSEEAAHLPMQSLEERFISDLTRLKESGESSNHLSEAAGLFRRYVGEKYSVPGGEKIASHELVVQVEGKVSVEEMRTLKRIFDRLDEWRYADREKLRENERYLYDEMIRFIEGKQVVAR